MPARTDDSAAARRQRGDEAAVRAAVITVAALSTVDLTAQETRDRPTVVIFDVLVYVLTYSKAAFPDDETVQTAMLDVKEDPDGPGHILIDSQLFFDAYIRLPTFQPLPEHMSPGPVYLDHIIGRGYSCIRQVTVSATDGLDLGDLPSDEEFHELVLFFALDDLSDLVSALSWVFNSDVHFGLRSDGTSPAPPALSTLESIRDRLLAQTDDASKDGTRIGQLKRRLAKEVALMIAVLRAAEAVYDTVDTAPSNKNEEAVLAEGINQAIIPVTRIVAAESLAYIRNRLARRASRPEAALSNYAEACRLAHFAFNAHGHARYAKYVAQNLLEYATAIRDGSRRILAEVIWIDAYALPYLIGLVGRGNAPFTELGWTGPMYAPTDMAIDYSSIPPYSVAPDFVYSGSIAASLLQISPSFPPDLWTAAVLLAQHLKDLGDPHLLLEPDMDLAVFVPADDASGRFPMREQHPVAWLYFLSDMLLREHRLRHPHAGLTGAPTAAYWYRRWIATELQMAFKTAPSERSLASRTPKFPQVAKYLLGPVCAAQDATSAEARLWSPVASQWAA